MVISTGAVAVALALLLFQPMSSADLRQSTWYGVPDTAKTASPSASSSSKCRVMVAGAAGIDQVDTLLIQLTVDTRQQWGNAP